MRGDGVRTAPPQKASMPIRMANNAKGTSPQYAVNQNHVVQNYQPSNAQNKQGAQFVAAGNQPGQDVKFEEDKIDYDNAQAHQKDMVVPTSYVNLPYDFKGSNESDSDDSDSEDDASDASSEESSYEEGASEDDSDEESTSR